MRNLLSLSAVGLVLAGLAAPAQAALYSTSFSGTVISQTNSGVAVGAPISGSFVYNDATNQFVSFTIGSQSASPSYRASVTVVPAGTINPYSAIYTDGVSAAQSGGNTNAAFTLDLEARTSFSTSSALALLNSPTLNSQIDPASSTFSYNIGTANGTVTRALTASLTSITPAAAVPEPATLTLLSLPLLGLLARRRR